MQRFDIEELEKSIGYTFKNKELLKEALTHSSYSNELRARHKICKCNERLEFLGDSVLSIITSKYLYSKFEDCPEGELTRMRSEVVCERALSGYADSIGLGEYLLLGIGEVCLVGGLVLCRCEVFPDGVDIMRGYHHPRVLAA